jgi:hypothetical protein
VAAAAGDPLVLSYAAKFVCLESLPPGTVSYSSLAPIVAEKTEVLIHNPNDYDVVLYRKAVRALPEPVPPVWAAVVLHPDQAVRMNCDDIAALLGEPPFGIGVKVEGFVVVAIGPQDPGTPGGVRYGPLDVTAEYSRSSEVLKKDISYQPWWWHWWWPLPWRLGYPYQRLIRIDPTEDRNIDCREDLVLRLKDDVPAFPFPEPLQMEETLSALDRGYEMYPAMEKNQTAEQDLPALVPMIGRCDKVAPDLMSVDYVLLSNKGPTDPNPLEPQPTQPEQLPYPWIPGRWYDLTVVVPQNMSIDLDEYMREWHSARWLEAEPGVDVDLAMPYFFPYWCGWGHWWWWWNGGDCIDIGVGEGESIDVEQITPVRVIMGDWWPPDSVR